tara:strand:- start:4117 stop:7725 length:3609 start_codon:yes stop_codon:yes gene_type:complete
MVLGKPQKYGTIKKSQYRPTKSKNKDAVYYRSEQTEKDIINHLINDTTGQYANLLENLRSNKELNKDRNNFKSEFIRGEWEKGNAYPYGSVLGNYTLDYGTDEDDREYISYYDKWNINPTKDKISDKLIDKTLGLKSPEIYGRVYLDELPDKQRGGGAGGNELQQMFGPVYDYFRSKDNQKEFIKDATVDSDVAKTAEFFPIAGEILDTRSALSHARKGEWGDAAMYGAAAFIPFVPGRALKKVVKNYVKPGKQLKKFKDWWKGPSEETAQMLSPEDMNYARDLGITDLDGTRNNLVGLYGKSNNRYRAFDADPNILSSPKFLKAATDAGVDINDPTALKKFMGSSIPLRSLTTANRATSGLLTEAPNRDFMFSTTKPHKQWALDSYAKRYPNLAKFPAYQDDIKDLTDIQMINRIKYKDALHATDLQKNPNLAKDLKSGYLVKSPKGMNKAGVDISDRTTHMVGEPGKQMIDPDKVEILDVKKNPELLEDFQRGAEILQDAQVKRNLGIKPQMQKPLTADQIELGASFFPFVGEFIDAKNTIKATYEGRYGDAVLNAAGFMIPFIPSKVLTKGVKSIKKWMNKNAPPIYKYNPWAFKPKSNAGYRMIGDEKGYSDAIKSGEIRPTSMYDHAHFNIGMPLNPNRLSVEELIELGSPMGYKGPYMAEMTHGNWKRMTDGATGDMLETLKSMNKHNDVWQHPSLGNIKLNDPRLTLYKEDWLRGYKPVSKLPNKQEGGDVDFEELEKKKQNPGWVANRLRKTVNPIGYNIKNAVSGFVKGKRQPFMWNGTEQTFDTFGNNLDMSKDQAQHIKSSSMDAWLKYLGFPQENETFVQSDFKPTIRKEDKKGTQNYWSFSNDDDIWDAASQYLDSEESVLIKDSDAGGYTMKDFTVENKYDPNTKLDYISYYDEFDFDIPTAIGNIKGERIAGEPYEIYGRMYYDKKYKDKDGNPRRIPNEVVDRYSIRLNDMKAGIQRVESLDGQLMKNPQSSATGRYGQLFNQIRKQYKGNRNSFAKDGDAQNKFFEKKFNGTLFKNEKGMQQTGYELYWEYQEVADKHGYSPVDIAALSNMLGRKGTREYLGYHLRDGKPLEEALPRIYGKRKKQQNKTPDEYIKIFREGVNDYRKIQTENLNSVLESLSLDMEKNPEFKEIFMKKFDIPLEEKGGEVLRVDKKNNRLRQQLLEYRKGNKISKVAMDELMSMGLI